MNRSLLAGLLAPFALTAAVAPALAQNYQAQQRWQAAQARFTDARARYQDELNRYNAERDLYLRTRGGGPGYPPPGYQDGPGYPPPGYDPRADDRDEGGYDPSRYYREEPRVQERVLASDDRVYRGSDGRYYCRRNDGTTGLIIGAAGGGVLGNVIDGGHSRAAGTLIGAAIGALAGRAVDQNNQEIRCR